ncbi:MAG: PepSY domain-containing protein [Agarilytica sp.]
MSPKKVHKIIGLTLLFPFVAWILTGIVFLTKPGYKQAYEPIEIKKYPVDTVFSIQPKNDWLEYRIFKTVLGHHLHINKGGHWIQLDPTTQAEKTIPDNSDITTLLQDAVSFNPQRYGIVKQHDNGNYRTSTDVDLTFNWNTMTISQRGKDTKLIGLMYKIHYLAWLGSKPANIVLGILGLLLLSVLVYYGVILSFTKTQKKPESANGSS